MKKLIFSFATLMLFLSLAFFSHLSVADDRDGDGLPGSSLHSSNDFLGLEVRDRQGEKVGKVQEVLIDLDNGRIAFAVISAGGVMGIGDSNLVVPWKALSITTEGPKVLLSLDKDQLDKVPKRTAEMSDREFHSELHRFFGVSPYWEKGPKNDERRGSDKNFRSKEEKERK